MTKKTPDWIKRMVQNGELPTQKQMTRAGFMKRKKKMM